MVMKLGHFESRSAIPGKFLNVVLEKDGEDLLDCWYEKLRITKVKEEEYPTYSKMKAG